MTRFVLNNNVFEFNEEFYLQTSGTAIGTKMAPSYANIFMSIFEDHLQALSSTNPNCLTPVNTPRPQNEGAPET
ncbi:hypothetical protein HOLleu_26268 [Holothuria leucospilota]|uniref:Uncharacterized protein n=1 Tax=Holothuria leucospilota TaxID=206669 RepID=A0A9Q1BU25_HOLLE|nr:hypothetical protein HOLleu_26268 [Holothuria leucospilota]